jgi:murein DD-endopeptidase MepM/ murein hydrolase activator NlpD
MSFRKAVFGVAWGAAIMLLLATMVTACRPASAEPPSLSRRTLDVRLTPDSEILRALIPPHATFAALLQRHGLLSHEAMGLVDALSRAVDLRRVRAGQPYLLDRFFDGRVREFIFELDRTRRVVARRSDSAPRFDAAVVDIPTSSERVVVEAAIDEAAPSLVQALEAAGERIELSLALAEIFSGEIDFSSDLQRGDSFRLVVDRIVREDGQFVGYGAILAAEFVNGGRRLQAIRFTPSGGKPGYYDADGRSLTRFFLKSPLKFEPRITSAFARARRHPILNYTRAHNGVDYAAPHGAPVGAVASGVVTFAGWAGGGGRTVRIRHAGGFESEYLHLSSIAVSRGAKVAQGALIGRVGSTGLATGPHLHYGLRRDGAYVNPVRAHQTLPPGEPVPPLLRAQFDAERDRLLGAFSAVTLRADDN